MAYDQQLSDALRELEQARAENAALRAANRQRQEQLEEDGKALTRLRRMDKVDAVDSEVDARVHHRPEAGPELVINAWAVVGTQAEMAARLGVSRETLRKLAAGHRLGYPMQLALERLAGDP